MTLVLEKLLNRRSKKQTLKLKILRFLTMPKTCLTMIKTVTYLTMMISTQTIKDYFDKYTFNVFSIQNWSIRIADLCWLYQFKISVKEQQDPIPI